MPSESRMYRSVTGLSEFNEWIILEALVAAAINAGEILTRQIGDDGPLRIERKQDSSPVTGADIASDSEIRSTLRKRLPTLKIKSEENGGSSPKGPINWTEYILVDPLDGTKEFIRGRDDYTVNLAFIRGDRPAIGVIYAPAEDSLCFAIAAHGCFALHGASSVWNQSHDFWDVRHVAKSIGVRKLQANGPRRIVVSRSHLRPETEKYIEQIRATASEVQIIPMGSALKFCKVAQGNADMYIRYTPSMEWDTAAGDLLVHEAGGSMYAIDTNEPLKYNKEDLRNPGFIAEGRRD